MPRKTRKQKIIAHNRKRVMRASIPHVDTPLVHIQKSTASGQKSKNTVRTPLMTETEKAIRSHTIIDITKTLVIISLLFAAQAGVYFAQRAGLLAHWLQ